MLNTIKSFNFKSWKFLLSVATVALWIYCYSANMDITNSVVASGMRFGMPLALASMVGIMCERSGVINIGIEGTMLLSGFTGFYVASYSKNILIGLVILIIWSLIKNPILKMIPAPLVVVLVGIALAKYFDLDHEHMYLFLPDASFLSPHDHTVGPKFLVAISDNFMSSFNFPDFSKIGTLEFWEAVISIGLVGSLESLLSAMAVDKLDTYKRHADLDKDLTAVGIGNLVPGLIGGLPMIAEIVRSSANVNNGAKTQWANFFHGTFLLLFVVLFPRLIHSIPLAALAALLVFTGFRLASPSSFAHVMDIGKEQLFIFVVTIIGVLATDLLVGVALGIVAKFLIHILRGVKLKNLFKIYFTIEQKNSETIEVHIVGSAIFSNFLALKTQLATVEKGQSIIFYLNQAYLIDHTVMEFFHDFQHNYEDNGGKITFIGLDRHESLSDHPLAVRRIKS